MDAGLAGIAVSDPDPESNGGGFGAGTRWGRWLGMAGAARPEKIKASSMLGYSDSIVGAASPVVGIIGIADLAAEPSVGISGIVGLGESGVERTWACSRLGSRGVGPGRGVALFVADTDADVVP
ncbi:hypothetical protein [Singulisphaera acidiphila]|uniref:hypothetical protein n=1 Tax=Singulisphaera acidiphila TaxID=466153 RepID=UPI0002D3ED19|nr:hypothetical protein [Singulisphaera acidiphila]